MIDNVSDQRGWPEQLDDMKNPCCWRGELEGEEASPQSAEALCRRFQQEASFLRTGFFI